MNDQKKKSNYHDDGIERLARNIRHYTILYKIARALFWISWVVITVWLLVQAGGGK